MENKLSDNLINFSNLIMLAHDRGEIIKLGAQLNEIICKAIEMENAGALSLPKEKEKTLSAEIKFTKEEIENMSKTFKKEFIANGCVGHVIKRPSGKKGFYYEIRYRRNGYNITVSNADIERAKKLFVEATKNLDSPELLKKNKLKFGTITDEWLNYKKDKIAYQTWQSYCTNAKRFFTEDWRNKQIAEIRTVDLDNLMRQFDNDPRMYEDMRTEINQIFKYAIASGIITHNPVTLIPFKRAERKKREALTDFQIKEFLIRIREPQYDRIRQAAYIFYFFGIRPCELDEEARFENGFFICRNRKRKGGKIEYKKIPIPKQAQGLIEFDKPIVPPLSYDRWLDLMKSALGKDSQGKELTPYNLRHTFASVCAEAVRSEVLDLWMGDSPERLVGKVYVHYKDSFMQEEMDKVKFIIL